MIIGLLLELLLGLFSVLTVGIQVAQLPSDTAQAFGDAIQYMVFGLSLLGHYIDVPYMMTLFGIVLGT